jgi:hypothetical protein
LRGSRTSPWSSETLGICGDKAKLKAYCDIGLLQEQMDQAEQKKDTKTVEALGTKADTLAKQIRPDYEKVMGGLDEIDPNSAEGKQHGAADVRAASIFRPGRCISVESYPAKDSRGRHDPDGLGGRHVYKRSFWCEFHAVLQAA